MTLASGTTTVTLDGAAMLASGCAMPTLPDAPDTETPVTPGVPGDGDAGGGTTPEAGESGGGEEGGETTPDEPEQIVGGAGNEPDSGGLPFTGLQLGALALLGLGALGAGGVLHARRRERRVSA